MCSNSISTLIYLCFCTISVYSQNNLLKICHEFTKSTARSPYFKYIDNDYAMSKELFCLKTNNQMRMCDMNGRRFPDSVECKTTRHKNRHCPDELFEIRSHGNKPLCLKVSTKVQAYNEEFCYGSNTIIPTDLTSKEIFTVTEFLQNKKINQYWLPIKRNNAFMAFEVRLPGKSWRRVLHNNLIQFKNKSDEHCLKHVLNKPSMNNSNNIIVAEPCNTLLDAVCTFKSDVLSSNGCPNGFGALTYRPSVCYGIDWKKSNHEEVHLKEYLQNQNLLTQIFAKYVTEKKQNDFFKIDYFSDTFGDEYSILMNPFGILKIVEKGMEWLPALSKQNIDPTNAIEMLLKMDEKTNSLLLVALNRKYLWVNKKKLSWHKMFYIYRIRYFKKSKGGPRLGKQRAKLLNFSS
ncbi:uncharacterized protein LOC108026670 [Drosophila biarmipes]|uniref:uncharacterized protein LOC108026670 n=1 Tax=Drosophila biarmipes TaxID=125945 RepID=UPI001CDA8C16|nr:uncharacterized protein LOC108026670 [Drosophila biarmipes]